LNCEYNIYNIKIIFLNKLNDRLKKKKKKKKERKREREGCIDVSPLGVI